MAIKDKLSPLISDYNILLAINNDIAERKKGLNSLNHDVTVSAMVNLIIGSYGWSDKLYQQLAMMLLTSTEQVSQGVKCKTLSNPKDWILHSIRTCCTGGRISVCLVHQVVIARSVTLLFIRWP